MEHKLKNPYISVVKGAVCSCGGSQNWSARWDIRRCGCGAVAMTDLALYLRRYHGCDGPDLPDPVPLEDYDKLCTALQRKYLPMIPPVGINGLSLAMGLDLYFRIHRIPLRALWGVRAKNIWNAMAQMLDRDLPVIFSVGQNIPRVWENDKLNLYIRREDGAYVAVSRVRAHYMTALAMDDTWLTVSSWGRQYYIHRQEYEDYGKYHSMALVNNVVWLKAVEKKGE